MNCSGPCKVMAKGDMGTGLPDEGCAVDGRRSVSYNKR